MQQRLPAKAVYMYTDSVRQYLYQTDLIINLKNCQKMKTSFLERKKSIPTYV